MSSIGESASDPPSDDDDTPIREAKSNVKLSRMRKAFLKSFCLAKGLLQVGQDATVNDMVQRIAEWVCASQL